MLKRLMASGSSNRSLPSDYGTYCMTISEKALYIILAAIFIYFIAYLFYRSHLISLMLLPLSLVYPRIRNKQLLIKRKREICSQFKDMLYSLNSSLTAGKSLENAFRDALRDLSVLYPNPDEYIILELEHMVRRIEMNETVEKVISDFAERTGLEDIMNFSDVIQICKRSGANLAEVVRNTSGIINDRIEIRQEIEMLLAQRKFEQKILNMIPVLLVLLLSVSASDYMEPVFSTLAGKMVMTAALILLAAAWFISAKIMDIKI